MQQRRLEQAQQPHFRQPFRQQHLARSEVESAALEVLSIGSMPPEVLAVGRRGPRSLAVHRPALRAPLVKNLADRHRRAAGKKRGL